MDPITTPNPEPQQADLLEQLLAGAAKKAAQEETQKLEQKGVVTRGDFSTALGAFKSELLDEVKTVVAEAVQKAQPPADPEADPEEPVKKGAGRKSTVPGGSSGDSTDPREANPVAHIIRKSRQMDERTGQPGYAKFDTTDKAIAWALTMKGLTQGMSQEPVEEDIDLSQFGL